MSRAPGFKYGLDFLRSYRSLIPEFPCGKHCITDIKIALINPEKRIHLLAAELEVQGAILPHPLRNRCGGSRGNPPEIRGATK